MAASARPGPGIRSAGPEAAGQTALPVRACEWQRRPVRRRGAARSEALCGSGGGAARGRGRGVVGAELEELDQLWICMDACIYVCMYVSIYLSMYNLSPSGLDGQPRDARRIASGEPAEGREPLRLRRASKVEWRAPPPSFPAKVEGPRLRRCQSPQGGEEGGRTMRRRATQVRRAAPPPPSTQPPHSHHAPRAPALTHPTHPTRLAPPPLRRAPRPRHALSAQAHTPRPAPPLPPPRTLAAAAALVRSGCWSYICKSQDRTDEYMVDTFTHLLIDAHSLLQLRMNAPQIHSPPEPMLERTLRTKNIGTDIGSILRGEGEMKGGGVRARIGTAAPETDSAHQARP